MLQRFQDELHGLGCVDKKILVAVSGGMDSVVLLDLLTRTNCTLGVAHANFQLRGEDSLGDETWVGQLADNLKIPFYSRRFATNNYAIENGLSIQMAARDLRYGWFNEVKSQEHYDLVATAHHANDNLETFLMNFIRGTGIAGLKGMPAKNNGIIRPLLPFTRSELEEYAKANRLRWREDASNATDHYHRNFLRHQIVPKLREVNPSIEETFRRNSERLTGSDELARWALKQLKETYLSGQNGQIKILKSILDLFPHPSPVLLELIKEYGFNLDQCREIVLASGNQSGKQFLSATHHLVVDRDNLIISIHRSDWKEIRIHENQVKAEFGPLVLEIERISKEGILSDKNQVSLAAERIHFPLLWRKWKPGDYFFPLGMANKKKLSDFLIDNKVSLPDKDNVTVLESAGEIVWVVGHRIDNRFKVTESTKTVLVARLSVNNGQ